MTQNMKRQIINAFLNHYYNAVDEAATSVELYLLDMCEEEE